MDEARGVVITAPSTGSGKTTITLGLLRAFAQQGRRVVSAKTGPDYIDPRFHTAASGRACFNLDPWAMRPEFIRSLVSLACADDALLIVEGVMGLFDGAEGGGGSTADLAELLGLPVVLVVDAGAQAQSAAAVVKGFATFLPSITVAGVILNRVAGPRHDAMIRAAVASLGIPVLGAVPNSETLALPSRHLGLVQAEEHPDLDGFVERAAKSVRGAIDLDALGQMARPLAGGGASAAWPPLDQRIAVARDAAFGFAYAHMLEGWRVAGAEVLPFSPLADQGPAEDADAVFLPGGYPELHAGRLAANARFLAGLRAAAARGCLLYGECGGFMTLGEYLIDAAGERHAMAGLLPLSTSFAERRLHLGYRRITHDGTLPWPAALRGHEFHYSSVAWEGEAERPFAAEDAAGRKLGRIGLRCGRVLGSYAHVIDVEDAA